MNRRKLVAFAMIALCPVVAAKAQTYMDHLRQDKAGKGSVTVTQSKAIDDLVNGKRVVSVTRPAEPSNAEVPRKETETRSRDAENRDKNEAETEIPTVDMRRKVMRGSRKVPGYRVQAFAGGNTRNDKQKAQQVGNAIKMKYPEQPVYVHFYSPRWICRVGNFRNYQEAQQFLKQVRAMGYGAATIVKGQITVQY
jgi:hypothetical protein